MLKKAYADSRGWKTCWLAMSSSSSSSSLHCRPPFCKLFAFVAIFNIYLQVNCARVVGACLFIFEVIGMFFKSPWTFGNRHSLAKVLKFKKLNHLRYIFFKIIYLRLPKVCCICCYAACSWLTSGNCFEIIVNRLL